MAETKEKTKQILSEHADKIAKRAEEHETFITKVCGTIVHRETAQIYIHVYVYMRVFMLYLLILDVQILPYILTCPMKQSMC